MKLMIKLVYVFLILLLLLFPYTVFCIEIINSSSTSDTFNGGTITTATAINPSLTITGSSTSSADTAFKVQNSISSPGLTVLNNGYVGIGTPTPSTALHVIGTITATSFSGNGAGLTGVAALNNNRTLFVDGVAKSTSGTTSTVLLYTAPVIAGGTLGVNGVLAITSKWSVAGTTTSYVYIPQFKINNTTIWYRNLSPNDTPPEYLDCYYALINRGSTTSQIGHSDKATAFAQTGFAFQTFTFDTSENMTFTALASGNAAQTITLESIIIKVVNP